MGKLNEIRDKLQAGSTPKQLIAQGYSRSSVYRENKKLKNAPPDMTTQPISDELKELRQKRDIIKLQKEIAELEADKENLPEKVAAIEKTVFDLSNTIENSVDTLFGWILESFGMDPEEAHRFADGWVKRNIMV